MALQTRLAGLVFVREFSVPWPRPPHASQKLGVACLVSPASPGDAWAAELLVPATILQPSLREEIRVPCIMHTPCNDWQELMQDMGVFVNWGPL